MNYKQYGLSRTLVSFIIGTMSESTSEPTKLKYTTAETDVDLLSEMPWYNVDYVLTNSDQVVIRDTLFTSICSPEIGLCKLHYIMNEDMLWRWITNGWTFDRELCTAFAPLENGKDHSVHIHCKGCNTRYAMMYDQLISLITALNEYSAYHKTTNMTGELSEQTLAKFSDNILAWNNLENNPMSVSMDAFTIMWPTPHCSLRCSLSEPKLTAPEAMSDLVRMSDLSVIMSQIDMLARK